MMSPQVPGLVAAYDGDDDRNLIIGRGVFVKPSDSLAMLAANAHLAPAYRQGIAGTGSDHVRENVGLWAVLLWLNILAVRQQSALRVAQDQRARYGRNHCTRYDCEEVDSDAEDGIFKRPLAFPMAP